MMRTACYNNEQDCEPRTSRPKIDDGPRLWFEIVSMPVKGMTSWYVAVPVVLARSARPPAGRFHLRGAIARGYIADS